FGCGVIRTIPVLGNHNSHILSLPEQVEDQHRNLGSLTSKSRLRRRRIAILVFTCEVSQNHNTGSSLGSEILSEQKHQLNVLPVLAGCVFEVHVEEVVDHNHLGKGP